MKRFSILIAVILLLASVLPVIALAVAEVEPNENFDNATPIELNTDVTGKIETYQDRDCYTVIVPEDGYISVDFDITTPYVLSELYEVIVYSASGALHGRDVRYPIGRVDGEIVDSTGIIGLRAGVYYIYVFCGDSGYNTEYKMKVSYTATEHCEIESNQDMHTATEIELNESYVGSISDADDQDWYCVNVPANGYVTIDFTHELVNSSKSYWSMWIYERDGSTSIDGKVSTYPLSYVSGKETEKSMQIGLPAGTYYIKISSGESYTYNQKKYTYFSREAYNLKVSFADTEFTELEPNSNSEKATGIEPNETYVGGIMKSSDEDWFKIYLPQDGYINVWLENKTASDTASVQLRVTGGSRYTDINGYKGKYGAECRYWEIKANESGDTGKIGLRAGTYYVWLSTRSDADIKYSFKVDYTQSAFTELEPNHEASFATDIDLNKTYMGSTSYAEDEDFYSFVLKKTNELTVKFSHMAHDKTISYWKFILIGPDGKTELKTYDIMGDTEGVLKLGSLPADRYYIKVVSSKRLSTNAYNFSVVEKHDCQGDLVVTKEPNCTEDGLGEKTCTICGQMYDYESIPAKGHTFGGWITDIEATCKSSGKCHRECSVCKITESEPIPQLSHKLGEWKVIKGNIIIPPIIKEQKCELCGLTEVTEDWGYAWVTVLAGIAAIGLCFGVVSYFKAYKNT